jgi:hypothetical protein
MRHDTYADRYECAPADKDKQAYLNHCFKNNQTMLQSGVQGVFGGNPYKC